MKRMIGHIGLMGLIGLILGACSSEMEELSVEQQRPISLNVYTSQSMTTRADSTLLAEPIIPIDKSIGVYAYYHDNSTWSDDATPNFMFNQQATNQGEGQTYSYAPLKYWPNEETDKLSFIAYYPYTDPDITDDPVNPIYSESKEKTGITPNLAKDGTGLPTFDFTVKDNVKKQVDFLVSDLLPNLPKTRDTESNPHEPFNDLTITDRVRFLFKHATSKIEFRVVVDADIRKNLSYFTLKGIQLTNIYNAGTLTPTYTPPVPPATEGTTTLNWSASGSRYTYNCKTTEAYLLLPQTLRSDANLVIDYDLAFKSEGTTYTYDGSGNPIATEEYLYNNRHSEAQLNTLKLSSTDTELTEWLPNHHYIYIIRIGAKRIEFTGQVVDWGDTQEIDDIEIKEP